jgi:pyrimidine-nucleoside phosphorylase
LSAVELIQRKRDGRELTANEINWLIESYVADALPDYQMAAFLMAVCWRGMTHDEIFAFTWAMARSGSQLRLAKRFERVADKHSTGGVGDKLTFVVAPIVAACGLPIAKMSGRGLGHTGGTIDKLDSIPGLRTELSAAEFVAQVERFGLALTSQSRELAPADGKLYALRDVTATIQSIPLIAASIMSKKLAIGPSDLVLDVKVGRGAFMKTLDEARTLAKLMVRIGRKAHIRTTAVLTAMDQPLGRAVGNLLEVEEAVSVLHGQGPTDVLSLSLHESALLLKSAGLVKTSEEGQRRAQVAIQSGAALTKFQEVIAAQGGVIPVDRHELYPVSSLSAPRDGWIAGWDAAEVGAIAVALGAGRARKEDQIDPEVGILLHEKAGSYVKQGQLLASICARSPDEAEMAKCRLLAALSLSDAPVTLPPLLLEVAK